MISNHVVIIPLIHDWKWTADFQRQTALALIKHQNIVIAFQLHKKDITLKRWLTKKTTLIMKHEGVFFITPLHIIPFERFGWIYQMNIRLSYLLLFAWIRSNFKNRKCICWIFHPRHLLFARFCKKFLRPSKLVYDYVDYFAGSSRNLSYLKSDDEKLLKEADKVFCIARENITRIKKIRPDVIYTPQGFRLQDFSSYKVKKNFPSDRPIIGYVGGINKRIDFDLLFSLINSHPEWYFVFWGPIQNQHNDNNTNLAIKKLLSLKNVIWGTAKNKKDIPGIISQFDIAIIPYDVSQPFNRYCYPMKVIEYFYMGKPVISTAIAELSHLKDMVFIKRTKAGWEEAITSLLKHPPGKDYYRRQRRFALDNTWTNKLEIISLELENTKNS